MAEASLAAKGTASGLVKDVKFLDMDTAFWQASDYCCCCCLWCSFAGSERV